MTACTRAALRTGGAVPGVRRGREAFEVLIANCKKRNGLIGKIVIILTSSGGPPEAMVSPEHHHSGIDVENKLYTYYRRTRNAILCLNKL